MEETRAVEGGEVLYRRVGTTHSGVASWVADPGRWYEGACGVVDRSTSAPVPVVGRRSLGPSWLASNGMVQCWVEFGDLHMQRWLPAVRDWSVPHRFRVAEWEWGSAEVVRNGPEAVTVRLAGTNPVKHGAGDLWVSLRRGWPGLACVYRGNGVVGSRLVAHVPQEPVTDFGHVVIPDAPDADGVSWSMASAEATTVTEAIGTMVCDGAPDAWPFALAAGLVGVGGDIHPDNVHRAWYAAQSELVRVGVAG